MSCGLLLTLSWLFGIGFLTILAGISYAVFFAWKKADKQIRDAVKDHAFK